MIETLQIGARARACRICKCRIIAGRLNYCAQAYIVMEIFIFKRFGDVKVGYNIACVFHSFFIVAYISRIEDNLAIIVIYPLVVYIACIDFKTRR